MGAKKSSKKQKKAAKNVSAFLTRVQELQTRSPTMSPAALQSMLANYIIPAFTRKVRANIEQATAPQWQEATKRAQEIQQLSAPGQYGDISSFFGERFKQYLTSLTEKKISELSPDIQKSIRDITELITSPGMSLAYGLTQESGKWSGLYYGGEAGKVASTLSEAQRAYQDALKNLSNYFSNLGIDLNIEGLLKDVWG